MASAPAGAQTIEYLRANGVPDIIDAAVRSLMESKSGDPVKYFADYFQKEMGARFDSITVGASVEIYGMAINKTLNGLKGKITGKQDEALVNFGEGHGVMAVKVGELKPTSGCVTAVGDEVQGVNIQEPKELSGKKGVVKAFRTKITVAVPGKGPIAVPQESVKLIASLDGASEDDLEKGMEVEVHKMLIDQTLNGKRGVIRMREDTVIVKVQTEGGGEEVGIMQLALTNVKAADGKPVKKGSEVLIQKMLIKKEMNGKKATVKQITSKYHVSFADGMKLLPRAALKKL